VENSNGNANKKLESALEYSVKLIDSGASIEDCLRLYPNQRKELRGLLEALVCVKQSYTDYPELRPSKLYMKTGKAKFLEAIENGVPAMIQEPAIAAERRSNIINIFRRAYVTATAAAAVAAILVGGLVYVSSDSLPGSPLYTVKRATESVQLALTLDSKAKAKLHYGIAQRRIAEAKVAEKAGEKGTAADIYNDAHRSLSEAQKMAKASSVDMKDNLEGAIRSLDQSVKDKTTKLAAAVHGSTKDTNNDKAVSPDTQVALNDNQSSSENNKDNSRSVTEAKAVNTDKQKRNTLVGTDTAVARRSLASIKPFEISSLEVAGQYISPNGDGVKDKLGISVAGAEGDYMVGLYKGATKIATIAGQDSGKDLDFTWDGADINGKKIADGKYSLRVENAIGQLAHRKAEVVVDTIAERVNLIEPLDGVSTENGALRFVWNPTNDADTYTLYLRSNASQGDYVVSGLTNNAYQLDGVLMPGDWEWHVVTIDKAGNTTSSNHGRFTVKHIDDAANQANAAGKPES
jgi:hypothetical protein